MDNRQPFRSLTSFGHLLQRLGGALARPPWPEFGLLLTLGGAHLYNSISRAYPLGYAGLYSLMAELVAHQPLPMPEHIPFYGPGGLPFAYPPLAAYLAAFFLGYLRIPIFAYLKWAPPLMTLAALIGLYYLARAWTDDRLKALVAVAAAGSAEITYAFHSTASGMVRAPALAFALAGAAFALKSFRREEGRWGSAALAGLLAALAALTHLAYALFLALGIALMLVLAPARATWRVRLRLVAVIASAAIVFSAPWWAIILIRHGPAVLSNASGTHGNLDMLGGLPWATLREVLRWLANYGRSWHPAHLAGLGLLAFAYAVARGRWLMPSWLVLSLLVIGQSDRFQLILTGIMFGEALVDLSRLATDTRFGRVRLGEEKVGSLACLFVVMAPILVLGFRGMQWTPSALSDELVEAASWIRTGTDPSASYLYLGEGHDEAEWLPFLTRRSPAVGHWGAEWTGDYDRQLALTSNVEACLDSPQTDCIDRLIEETGFPVSALVLHKDDTDLSRPLQASPDWQLAWENAVYAVFLRRE